MGTRSEAHGYTCYLMHVVFRHKFKSDGLLDRHKARLVVNDNSQTLGMIVMRPLVRLLNRLLYVQFPVCLCLHLGKFINLTCRMHFYLVILMKVSICILPGYLNESVYMYKPPIFMDP